jgi:alkylation response protein AidB-like acyl-CoA dehydrogenase
MTFDFTPHQQDMATRARTLATNVLGPAARMLDEHGTMPPHVMQEVAGAADLVDISDGHHMDATVSLEAIAHQSPGIAAVMGLSVLTAHSQVAAPQPEQWPGLRGAEAAIARAERLTGAARARGQMVVGIVAVGIGWAAVGEALAALKRAGRRPGEDTETPHWAIADAATDVDAARLLVWQAASAFDRGEEPIGPAALAKGFACAAAERAIEAALRVIGPSGYRRGSLLERLSRDARTTTLILGTGEQVRATAASALLPQ